MVKLAPKTKKSREDKLKSKAEAVLKRYLYPDEVLFVDRTLREGGFDSYLVGGAVRDILLGRADEILYDYDFATNATPEEVMKLFISKREKENLDYAVVPTGIKHGTVSIVINGRPYEITTYRTDYGYSDGRHPDRVEFLSSIDEDLWRRDFTINALAYDIEGETIKDPTGGLQDLERGVIRAVGDPVKRFSEDGLRPVRACRFKAQLNFEIEPETFNAITLTLDTVKKVSPERIRDELIKLLQSPKPSVGIECMRKSGLLYLIIPELLEGYGVPQNEYHRYDVYWHNLITCDAAPRSKPLVRLAALLHDIAKPRTKRVVKKDDGTEEVVFYNHEIVGERMAKRIMRRLRFSNAEIRKVCLLIRNHMFYYTYEWTDGAVRRFLRRVGEENLEDLFDLREADRIGNGKRKGKSESLDRFKSHIQKIIEEDTAFSLKDLAVNGYDVMNTCGIPPSPLVGKTLNYLLNAVLDDPSLNEKDKLLKLAKDFVEKELESKSQ